MSTRSNTAQGSNQPREVLESPAFTHGENVKSLEVLQFHQRWRRGLEKHMGSTPKEVGIALDDAIEALAERPVARAAAVKMAGEIQRFRKLDNSTPTSKAEYILLLDDAIRLADNINAQIDKLDVIVGGD